MKKVVTSFIVLIILLSISPAKYTEAAPLEAPSALPKCSISQWNYNGVSGGCTCYVAERIKSAKGKTIPWGGNAGLWWDNSKGKWNRNENEPRVGSIAAFSYGHVAYIDSVKQLDSRTTIMSKTNYTVWLIPLFMKFPITRTAVLYRVTETYQVNASQRDYTRVVLNDNSVRYSKWNATLTRYYWADEKTGRILDTKTVGKPLPVNIWNTPRNPNSGSNGLQGYIYPP